MYVDKSGESRIITITTKDNTITYNGWITAGTRKVLIETIDGTIIHIYPSPEMIIEVD